MWILTQNLFAKWTKINSIVFLERNRYKIIDKNILIAGSGRWAKEIVKEINAHFPKIKNIFILTKYKKQFVSCSWYLPPDSHRFPPYKLLQSLDFETQRSWILLSLQKLLKQIILTFDFTQLEIIRFGEEPKNLKIQVSTFCYCAKI